MTLKQELDKNLRELINRLGSEHKLSELSGVTQANINKIKNGNVSFDSIRLGTLIKLFPDIRIDFTGTGKHSGHIGEIVKMLNRLTEDQQLQIMLDIVARYPNLREMPSKTEKSTISYAVEDEPAPFLNVAEKSTTYKGKNKK